MTLSASVTINNTTYDATNKLLESINVTSSLAQENFTSASFEARLDNTAGTYASTFDVGQDVQVKLDTSSPASTLIFRGIVESIEPESIPNREYLVLRGRDYSSKLADVTALETYLNTEVSAIVTNLMSKYINTPSTQITTSNVQTTTKILTNITFRRKPLFECIKLLAELVDYDFWVDETKDLHFQPGANTSSGITLDNSNVENARFITNDQDLYNKVWVYGGRYLSGFREDFIANGGSVFNIVSKPHNTSILVAGSIQKGGIFEISVAQQSGVQYLVDFDNKKIVFVSGTTYGNNLPTSGGSVIINYDRSLPIVKLSEDSTSQTLYGVREKIIVNNEITDPSAATQIVRSELSRYKNPRKMGILSITSSSIAKLTVGQTLIVNLPNQNIDSVEYQIISVDYKINTRSLLSNKVLQVRVNQRVTDMIDLLKKQVLDLKQLQAQEVDTSDVYTKLVQSEVSGLAFVKSWFVKTRSLNDSFVLGMSKLGSVFPIDNAEFSGGTYSTNVTVQNGQVTLI